VEAEGWHQRCHLMLCFLVVDRGIDLLILAEMLQIEAMKVSGSICFSVVRLVQTSNQ
jgi:hypothetical protein